MGQKVVSYLNRKDNRFDSPYRSNINRNENRFSSPYRSNLNRNSTGNGNGTSTRSKYYRK